MSVIWSVLGFIVAISVLVAFHEFGHFWAARCCRVKIERFSIGFGKVLWSKTDKLGTEFAISAIPLGGYVKMLDERQQKVPDDLKPFAFNHKTVWQRIFIVSAGPIANLLLAVLLYTLILMIGVPTLKPIVAGLETNSIAEQANLPIGMQITAIDGKSVQDWNSINMLLAAKVGEQKVDLTFSSIDGEQKIHKVLTIKDWQYDVEKKSAFAALGIKPVMPTILMKLSKVMADSPAQQAGLRIGDILFSSNGDEIQWEDFVHKVQLGKPILVQVARGNERFVTTLIPQKNMQGKFIVGLAPTENSLPAIYQTVLRYTLWNAIGQSAEKTMDLIWLTVKVIGKLLTGQLSTKNLSGPIAIAKNAGMMAQFGLVYYLNFLAIISINLGIMNLLPLPVLDGGHLLFLMLETIKKKPISEKTQQIAYQIGVVLLLILTAFALFNDLLQL